MTENKAAAPVEYEPPQGCQGFLEGCMRENLSQARHVESERMLVVSLFGALSGVVLAMAAQLPPGNRLSCVLVIVLICLNVLCMFLVRRWNSIFYEHRRIAKEIYTQILCPPGYEGPPLPRNKYYYFDNTYSEKHGRHKKFYIPTGWLFVIYICAVLLLLVCVLFYFWGQAPPVEVL